MEIAVSYEQRNELIICSWTVALSCILGHFPVKIRVQVCANPNSSDSNTGQILLPRAIFPWIDFSLVPGVARLGRSLLNSVILRCEIIQLNRINYLWLLNDHHGGKNMSWKRRIQRLEWNWSQQIYDDRVCCNFFDDKFDADEAPQ